MQEVFFPQPAGTLMKLENHHVRVNVVEHVRANQKVYFVDVDITAFPKPSTVTEVLQDAFDLATRSALEVEGGVTSKAIFRDTVKRLRDIRQKR